MNSSVPNISVKSAREKRRKKMLSCWLPCAPRAASFVAAWAGGGDVLVGGAEAALVYGRALHACLGHALAELRQPAAAHRRAVELGV
jgi:hypothetical protein